MATQNLQQIPLRKPMSTRRYGITEKKKAELDDLTLKVLDAQQDVEQFQAIVASLTDKSNQYQAYLATADANRAHALDNRNMLDQLVQSALDLQSNSQIAFNESVEANMQTKEVAKKIKVVMDKLIYASDIINRLYSLIIRKKALNPLISDDLVSMIGNAGKDANNAVALTLIALKSAFTAEASNMESEAASSLEYQQSIKLYGMLTVDQLTVDASSTTETVIASLRSLLYKAYAKAKTTYDQLHQANLIITQELNAANTSLNKAQVKLRSLQSSLAAANAAAYAS